MKRKTLALVLAFALLLSLSAAVGAVERYQVLMYGDEDEYVKEAQTALYKLGFLKTSPTGYYGTLTVEAVKAFQKSKGLAVDGIIGLGTRKVLLPNAKPIPSTRFASATPTPAAATPTPTVSADPASPTPSASVDPNASPTPTPSSSAAASTTPVATGIITAKTSLTLRSAASKTASSLGEIPRAAEVSIYASKGDYYRISYRDKMGYALKSYINVLPKAVVKGTVTATKLNLRSTASESGTIIQSFKKGDVLNIISQVDSKWYKVMYIDKIGYCVKTGVELNSGTLDTSKSYVKATNLNLRSAPNSGASVIARLPQFTAVTVLDDLDEWLKIQAAGKTGYVMAEFIIRPTN